MQNETIAKLGKLMGRAALLELVGQTDAAIDLTQRSLAELEDMPDQDVQLAFMGGIGFLSAAANLSPDPQLVALLAVFTDAAREGGAPEMRAAVSSLFSMITPAAQGN